MFHFAEHHFDPGTGEVEGPRGSTRLQPKPARLLAMLLEADGGLVERDDAALWPDTNVDFDAGLNTCVRQIRAALSDTGGAAEWVETLPKRGYRVAVAVRAPELEPPATSLPAVGDGSGGENLNRRAVPYVAMLLVIALATAAALWSRLFVTADPTVPGDTPPQAADAGGDRVVASPRRLAVVPFVDPEADDPGAFNRSLSEAYVAALVAAAPDEVVVVGPTTTAPLWSPDVTIPQIAAAVEADFVMHGGHRASDSIFFIQVVHPDGAHLFARRFELPAGSPPEAPPELVAAIIDAVRESRVR